MPESNQPKPSLSDIGHLFLSSIRERHTGGAPPPLRRGPGAPPPGSIDLSPEEFAKSFHDENTQNDGATPAHSHANPDAAPSTEEPARLAPVSVLLASHLGVSAARRSAEYAAHLARAGRRVGLIEIDAALLRVTVFEKNEGSQPVPELPEQREWSTRQVSNALEELSWDVPCWLLSVSNLRSSEARALLPATRHWTLLSGCEDEGIVAAYRLLKGASEVPQKEQNHQPIVSLALLGGGDSEAESQRVFLKLAGVCRQFLGLPLVAEPPVRHDGGDVTAHIAINAPSPLPGNAESATHWEVVVASFVRALQGQECEPTELHEKAEPTANPPAPQPARATAEPAPQTPSMPPPELRMPPPPAPAAPRTQYELFQAAPDDDAIAEVIDLPSQTGTGGELVRAVVASGQQFLHCPITAPMCPEAAIALARDGRLVVVAVAGRGLTELRSIGTALRWVSDSRGLIAMALPQLAIDVERPPALRLLVDSRDAMAEALSPLLHDQRVVLQTYKRLKWGAKTGLLLQAA